MVKLDLPVGLEPFRSKLEATVKPYIDIQTQFTRETTLWQSKFAGFPYLPKGFAYPTTPEGDYLHLLAQINFNEVPNLEGYPTTGILQFYFAADENGLYGMSFENPTEQSHFRVLYFPTPNLNENNLITNFDFLPTLWNYDNDRIPFWIFHPYVPHRDDCFALSFDMKFAPISDCDYKFRELIGNEMWDLLDDDELRTEYQEKFVEGHSIGGYPSFAQEDFREFLSGDEEPYILLLQIDFDPGPGQSEKVSIQWGDIGVGNFWIKESALKNLDFSEVLYHWNCS